MAAREDRVSDEQSVVPSAPADTAGAKGRDPNIPRSLYLDAAGAVHRDLKPRELAEALASGTGELWVDIDSGNRHQHAVLEKVFRFHPLAIEDTLSPSSRVKLEEFDGYLFAIVRGVQFHQQTDDPYDILTFNQYYFLGRNYLVTVHAEPSASIADVAQRIERTPELMARHSARIMHAIMDAEVDAFFPILDQIDEFVDSLEERVFANFDEAALRDIFAVKRLVLGLRRHLAPQREVFNIMTNRPSPLLSTDVQVYFRDIYDHVLRINDSLETYRELLSSVLDSYLSQISNRLGRVTKGLSVVATLSIPFVVVSGMWGMNFEHIPLSGHVGGFWIMLFLQMAIGVLLVLILKRGKLL